MKIATALSIVLLGLVSWAVIGCTSPDTLLERPGGVDQEAHVAGEAALACETDVCCANCDRAGVTRVIDGDTIETADGRVRVYGVDTPEVGERCFSEATKRMGQLTGRYVRTEAGPRAEDDYGRILAYLYTDDGDSIDEILIREGLATAWEADGQHRDRLMQLEAQARLAREGCLWR